MVRSFEQGNRDDGEHRRPPPPRNPMKDGDPGEPSGEARTLADTCDPGVDAAADAGAIPRPGPPRPGCPGPRAKIAHYDPIRLLGRGATADVVLARDTRLGRLVALKLPRRGKRAVERLLGEARVLACLQHENIVAVHEVGLSPSHPYMAMEYVCGWTLRALARGSALAAPSALELVIPVVRAAACAHEAGFVHRDLKPENVMRADAGAIKVLDFGLAHQVGAPATTSRARHGNLLEHAPAGSLPYMAPEQLRCEHVDTQADVWAVGVILLELLLGRHPLSPFGSGWLSRLADVGVEVELPGPRGDLCPELVEILKLCLRKRPEERFRSAAELLAALTAVRAAGSPDDTWSARVAAVKRQIAQAAYAMHGSCSAAARALAVDRSTLRRHLALGSSR